MYQKSQYRSCVGGILLIIASVLTILRPIGSLISNITTVMQFMSLDQAIAQFLPSTLSLLSSNIITVIPIVIFAVVLMLRKYGKPVLITCAILLGYNAVSYVYGIFSTVMRAAYGGALSINWAGLIALASYFLMLMLCIDVCKPQPGSFRKMWFLPGLVYCLYTIAGIVTIITTYSAMITDGLPISTVVNIIVSSIISQLPAQVLYVVAYFLIGNWLANPYAKGRAPQSAAAVQNVYQQRPYQQPIQNPYPQPRQNCYPQPPVQSAPQHNPAAAQELERYKSLLDAGAITQEEYDTVKKRILGI